MKENQPNLFSSVVNLFDKAETTDWSGIEYDFHRTINKGHGRTEIRRHWTVPVTELFFDEEKWVGLESVGLIESVRKIDGETTTNKRYYLNSFSSDASLLASAVRSHWGVENNVHWILDVAFKEDDCPIHSDHAPANLSQLRKMSLNLLSNEKSVKIGVANKRLKAAWDNQYLAKVLSL